MENQQQSQPKQRMDSTRKKPMPFTGATAIEARDWLIRIEQEIRETWSREAEASGKGTWEIDAPSSSSDQEKGSERENEDKYFVTFPYPYMNGCLHLGHAFTIVKADFVAGHQRMKGKRTLFPFAFHATGMPIKSCADKLKREMAEYGVPPQFPAPTSADEKEEPQPTNKARSGKAKLKAKTGNTKYQWDIMQEMDVDTAEIPKFADASYWLQYFPPCDTEDLKTMGARIDWRRSFITTDANPYYDSFVRWQFEVLREKHKIIFDKRYAIFSPAEKGPCGDDARQIGEGIMPKEHILVKQEVVRPYPSAFKSLEGRRVYVVAAMSSEESLYRQSGCYVDPRNDYDAYEMSNEDVFICAYQVAKNLSYQGCSKEEGEVICLAEFSGADLIGVAVKTPVSDHSIVHILPSTAIPGFNEDIGVSHIVFEDAKALERLQESENLCEQYGVKPEWIYSDEENNNSEVKVDKEIAIKLLDSSKAIRYWEPEGPVYTRTGDLCVVALTPQWYIQYGESDWKKATADHVAAMDLSTDVRKIFEEALDWLNQKPCSRSYGLGTVIPWDPQYLIDSLSDSTIYMAYYTVAHLLHGPDNIFGAVPGPSGIKPEQLTRAVWDYIFLDTEIPSDTTIPHEILRKMRDEFRYWYPVNMRVSGKDLIKGHLTFFLYNHTAFFPPSQCPRSIRPNGFLLLNGKKMSKSTGNFRTLKESMIHYSVTGMRFALADSGDSVSDDANFQDEVAATACMRLRSLYRFYEETLESMSSFAEGEPTTLEDFVFQSKINQSIRDTDKHYQEMRYHDALMSGFYSMQEAMKKYKTGTPVMNRALVTHFLRTQLILLVPIMPHYCEYVWRTLWTKYFQGEPVSINDVTWPQSSAVDEVLLMKEEYLRDFIHKASIRAAHLRDKGEDASHMCIYVATSWPAWQTIVAEEMQSIYDKETNSFPDWKKAVGPAFIKASKDKREIRKMFALAEQMVAKVATEGPSGMILQPVPFDEVAWLESQRERILAGVPGVTDFRVVVASPQGGTSIPEPLNPSVLFGDSSVMHH